jgi:hypothetical protein
VDLFEVYLRPGTDAGAVLKAQEAVLKRHGAEH